MTPEPHVSQRPEVPLIGAFAPLRALKEMDPARRRRMTKQFVEAGITHLLTEGRQPPVDIERDALDAGLRLGGGLSCFSDHAEAIGPVPTHLRPISPTGDPRPVMEWYRGIIPTDRGYEEDLIRACVEAVDEQPLDIFLLDFIRWPLHWELELRDNSTVIDSSFDPITLRRFRDEMDVDVPIDAPLTAAEKIESSLTEAWATFKCRVITQLVERIVEQVRAVSPLLPIGAYIVPGTEAQRRRYAGQDVAALAGVVDLLLPMAYHAILQRPPTWVGEIVSDIESRAPGRVVPVIQVTADHEIAGANDWGGEFGPDEFGAAIDAALAAGGRGFVSFPAHGLDPPRLAQVHPRALGLAGRHT